ncbi:diguanylate cyclase [Clostridium sp. SYSU_GA19001]|uniref:diguanylate cyclase n=1 Tax=Clostridium caldaquaticum TaxID=2940653 RepID=UPI0020776857|nr:diguanylate cyclase [Clostridium caldaquaticum]MCM8711620.1 diguanylate cyclase [Clostridium caldaquaticum]
MDKIPIKKLSVTISTIKYAVFCKLKKIICKKNMYEQLCVTDRLTKVATLDYILELGDSIISKGGKLTAYVIDIDHFKQINDTFGYFIGNELLSQISNALKNFVLEYKGIVGRLGGDEFVILVENLNKKEAENLLNKLTEDLKNRYFNVDKELTPVKIAVSAGMTYTENQSINIQELLHRAEVNMYYNKQQCQGIIIDKSFEEVLNEEYKKLLHVLCEKDIYSYVHSQFVVQYAVSFAKYLDLPYEQINDINIASWLHDIGKILVSNDILRKRGKLTNEEYTTVKSHVLLGIAILSVFGLPESLLEGIRYHHERYDGKGYPYGIKGEDIPLSARIIQIADSFCAMTIKRVYREKFKIEDALKEIEKYKGTQFDPYLSDKFIEFTNRKYTNK